MEVKIGALVDMINVLDLKGQESGPFSREATILE